MLLRIGHRLLHALQDRLGCGQVGIADSQVDNIDPASNGLLLHLVNGRKQIRG